MQKGGDEGNMIRLEKINKKNVWDILKLRVSENQRPFVASNDISIIEAYISQNENGHAFPFGIYDDETPVGFCMIGYGVDDSWIDAPAVAKDSYHIWRLMIDEKFQGKGFGKEAMKRILDFIRTNPCGLAEKCWLSYEPENIAAKKLYHSFGFQETGDLDKHKRIAAINLQESVDVQSPDEDKASDNDSCNQAITKNSSPKEKANLFMQLFHGRDDVYAKRWESPKKGTSGYSPACKNEWIPGVCRKPCSKCSCASYLPYTQDTVLKHLSVDDDSVFGIYAIQPDDTCWFLAIDLDESTWEKDVQAIREVCAIHRIPCAVEKSRSGNGAHIWFFFCEKVPAATARRMGSSIVTAAMRSNARLSFASYDRMFPNQDTMPKGGFGNLIALPLQPKAARSCGGSLFIDEQGTAYSDQWLFLSSIKRMALSDVETTISQIGLYPLGKLVLDSEEEKPWKRGREDSVPENDSTKSLTCVIGEQIYISTDGVSNIVQDKLKRLAAFRNPEFYQKQAMRMPIWDTPRVICCAEYIGKYLCLPRGCTEEIERFASDHHLAVEWQDEQCKGKSIDVSFRGTLYMEQQIAFETLKQYDKGVLSATTAFGKTVIGAALIGEKKISTLILVHRKALLDQWKERLEEFLDMKESLPEAPKKRGRKKQLSLIGTYGAGKNTRSGIIDIAMMQSIEKHPTCGLAYCWSFRTDENGTLLWDVPDKQRINFHRGEEFVSERLVLSNVIVNVSSCMFKREFFKPECACLYENMRLCGDWLFYVLLAEQTDVVEVQSPLNYCRRHGTNISESAEAKGLTFLEGADVLDYVLEHHEVKKSFYSRYWGRQWAKYRRIWGLSAETNDAIHRRFITRHKAIVLYYYVYVVRNLFRK